jgi:hypothetical protein
MMNRQEDHLLLIWREMPADLLPTYMYRVRYMISMIMLRRIWKGTTDDTTPYLYLEAV